MLQGVENEQGFEQRSSLANTGRGEAFLRGAQDRSYLVSSCLCVLKLCKFIVVPTVVVWLARMVRARLNRHKPQETAAQLFWCIKCKPSHHISGLLWSEQATLFPQIREFLCVFLVHNCVMSFPQLPLHVGVDYTWSNRQGRYVGLFGGKRQSQMVESGLCSAVASPSGVRVYSRARRYKDDPSARGAQGR